MVLIGSWPYQHTMTLTLLSQSGQDMYYLVDQNKIVFLTANYQNTLYVVDSEYRIISSKDIYDRYIAPYREQNVAPTIPSEIQSLIDSKITPTISNNMQSLSQAPILMIVDGKGDNLHDIGATWNNMLNIWTISNSDFEQSRQSKKLTPKGRLHISYSNLGQYKVTGDLESHLPHLRTWNAQFSVDKSYCYVDKKYYHLLLPHTK